MRNATVLAAMILAIAAAPNESPLQRHRSGGC